jgi:homoserine kinase type II
MYLLQEAEAIREDVFHQLTHIFHIDVVDFEPIKRGWRNYKWKIYTPLGTLFVKQYHPERYPLEKLKYVNKALHFQAFLHTRGLPCPSLYSHQGQYLLRSMKGTHFVLMEFCPGKLIPPGQANPEQMYHLGQVMGRMHKALQKFPLDPIDWQPNKQEMVRKWEKHWKRAIDQRRSSFVLDALAKVKNVLDRIDMEPFEQCPIGWAHWDFWVENLLFSSDQVTAVLDFDRVKTVYPELDVARAVMSCAWNGEVRKDLVQVFLEGYRESIPFTKEELARSLRLIWCHDSLKWIRPEMEERPGTAERFAREMLWITENWGELEDFIQ